MAIEKAFAIHATPDLIFAALERDLAGAEFEGSDAFQVLSRDPPRTIALRVTIAGVPCWLTYTLTPSTQAPGVTEVAARLAPFGWRYTFFRIITFGLRDQGFAFALVQGLANLKAAVEDEERSDEPPRLT